MYQLYEQGGRPRVKREPISTLTIALLVGLGVTGAGTGVASLVTQHGRYNHLRQAIDDDLERIETSISRSNPSDRYQKWFCKIEGAWICYSSKREDYVWH